VSAVIAIVSVMPGNEPRVALTIEFPTGTLTAAVNAKAVRKVIAAVNEADEPASIVVVVQGRIEGSNLLEAGISVIAKTPKLVVAEPVA
jgi:hypothetical protein